MAKNLDPQFEIETALPDPEERRAVLRQLVASIEYVDGIAPKAWVLSLKPKPGRTFCLTVGITEVLVLQSAGLRLLLEGPLTDELIDRFGVSRPATSYASGGPDQFQVTLQPREVAAATDELTLSHQKFIKMVGTRRSDNEPRGGTPNAAANNAAFVAYVRREAEGRPSKYFVLQWNEDADRTSGTGPFGNDMNDRWTWTSGNTTKIRADDIVVLRRTGAIKGIVGYGKVLRGSYPDMRTESNGNPTLVDVAWIATSSRPALTKSDPRIANMPNLWVQANGAELNADDGEKLIAILSKEFVALNQSNKITDESDAEARRYPEGRKYEVRLSVHERDPKARLTCIEHHKPAYACQVCEMNFADKYGADIGAEFIHVHHKKPLPMGVRDTDPRNDLIPVCPNCHAMLHKEDPPMCPEDLKLRLRARRQT
ncbi:MAG: HNH endonuclease [Hyphomicrobiaceae bacterium]|nr:hypothetical protein [Hyphomicrobiaceae bacterium]